MGIKVHFVGCLYITDQMFSVSPMRLPTHIITIVILVTVHSNHHYSPQFNHVTHVLPSFSLHFMTSATQTITPSHARVGLKFAPLTS
jgi:hypothetical protein